MEEKKRNLKRTVFLLSVSLLTFCAVFVWMFGGFGTKRTKAGDEFPYEIWLGETRMTEENYKDILGDGSAYFDTYYQELHLNNPTIPGVHTFTANVKDEHGVVTEKEVTAKIYLGNNPLYKVTGSYHMESADADYGIYGTQRIWVSGDFTIKGNYCGVYSASSDILFYKDEEDRGNFNIEGGTYAVLSDSSNPNECLSIRRDIRVELKGGKKAVEGCKVNPDYSMKITSPEDAVLSEGSLYEADGTTPVRHVVFDRKIGLWIGSTLVTEANQNDVLGDQTVSYDPATKTLLLNDPVIKTNYSYGSAEKPETVKIFCMNMDLTIKGIYHESDSEVDYPIVSYCGVLTLDGDFSISSRNCAFYAVTNDPLIFSAGTYSLNTGNSCFLGVNELTFGNGVQRVELKTESEACIDYIHGFQVDPALTLVEPENGSYSKYGIFDSEDKRPNYALFVRENEVVFDAQGHGTAPDPQKVISGEKTKKPEDLSEEGYVFKGWFKDPECTTEYDFDAPVTYDITIYAGWKKLVTVKYDGDDPALADLVVEEGMVIQKRADPVKEGYEFAGWYTDPECTKEFDFSAPITGDITIYAKFLKLFTISLDLNGGTLDGKTGVIEIKAAEGTKLVLPKPEKDGFVFDFWKGSRYEAGAEFVVSGDHTLKAYWKSAQADSGNAAAATGYTSYLIPALLLMMASVAGIVLFAGRRKQV